jgi:hypothetical protein
MCGIFGLSGKKGKPTNLYKLMILGLYNEYRGNDSCGYYYNGNIVKGTGWESDFREFIAAKKLEPGPLKTKVFMGHTRKATSGDKGEDNAHPHVVDDTYVQTHNGVIKNPWSMCSKFKVEQSKIKLDSIALANCIYYGGLKQTLEEYEGFAALAFTYVDKPESLYLFHGKSKEYVNSEPKEERPLFFLRQPEGLYYSSIEESLKAINSIPDEVEPKILNWNIVFEIVEGEFTDRTLPIDRENKVSSNYTPNTNYSAANSQKTPSKVSSIIPVVPKPTQPKLLESQLEEDVIATEKIPGPVYPNRVYYCRGKYWNLIPSSEDSKTSLYVLDGKYVINRECEIIQENRPPDVTKREHEYYFINGVMMASKESFEKFKEDGLQGINFDTFKILSNHSKYPIMLISSLMNNGTHRWYHKGNEVSKDAFKPKFSNKTYIVRYGKTVHIRTEDYVQDTNS